MTRELHSESLDKLLPSLHKARQSMESVTKAKDNPGFKGAKYADLAACHEAADQALQANGMFISDSRNHDGQGGEELVTTLWHAESAQWMRSYTRLKPAKEDPQGFGSAMTYARRYAYLAMLGLAPEDDDGNAASAGNGNQRKSNGNNTAVATKQEAKPAFESEAALITFTDTLSRQFGKAQTVAEVEDIKTRNLVKLTAMKNSSAVVDRDAALRLKKDYEESLAICEANEKAGQKPSQPRTVADALNAKKNPTAHVLADDSIPF